MQTDQGIDKERITTSYLDPGAKEFLLFVTSSSIKDLEENMNKNNPLTLQIESGQYEPGDNSLVDQVDWKVGKSKLNTDNRLVLIAIKEILEGGDQNLDEVRGQVISDYQTELEKQWIDELRGKYLVDIHENQVEAVYEQYNN